jgi:hypothetical protein
MYEVLSKCAVADVPFVCPFNRKCVSFKWKTIVEPELDQRG